MDVIQSILAFIVALGVLVTVHEFGHFWVARRLGVKVLRFSVGFGKPFYRYISKKDDTEYALAAIPLGGYVKMLDEREDPVPTHLQHAAFNRQSVYARMAILFAGPGFNFIFAICAFFLIYTIGTLGWKPVVGDVVADSVAAYSGIEAGDEILRIGDKPVATWEQAAGELIGYAIQKENVAVAVKTMSGREKLRQLMFSEKPIPDDSDNPIADIGMMPAHASIPPKLGEIAPGGAAEEAGIVSGDLIIAVDGAPIKYWHELVGALRGRPGQTVDLALLRDGNRLNVSALLREEVVNGKAVGRLGVGPQVDPDFFRALQTEVKLGFVDAAQRGVVDTWNGSVLTLRVLWSIVTGKASVKNLSGPIRIADAAGKTAEYGLVPFLKLMALISISLGVLNLLPIPVLDGGHILFCMIEAVRGKPVSEQTLEVGFRIGLGVLAMVMGLALFNDINWLLS